jgi:NDP-sugar pyrophosphorylase family protein
MDAIVLAGGMGTRLRSVIPEIPKPMAPVNGRPFLDLLLTRLALFSSIDRVVLAVGYKAELVEARYRNNTAFGFDIEFSIEAVPMGTGGALYQALPLTGSHDVLFMNGDSYVDFDLDSLTTEHRQHRASVTMVVVHVNDTARFGSVDFDPEGYRVLGFSEKRGDHRPGFINAGCYLLARRAFERSKVRKASFERDVLPGQLQSTYAHVVSGRFIDIGTPESYALASEYLR